jgi:hypothetical protein
MFVVGPLIIVATVLTLIPVVPRSALWELGIGIGFYLIFGCAAWLAVPARVCMIEHKHIGTATGVMITLAAIGGFFIPIIFWKPGPPYQLRHRVDLSGRPVPCLCPRRTGWTQPGSGDEAYRR